MVRFWYDVPMTHSHTFNTRVCCGSPSSSSAAVGFMSLARYDIQLSCEHHVILEREQERAHLNLTAAKHTYRFVSLQPPIEFLYTNYAYTRFFSCRSHYFAILLSPFLRSFLRRQFYYTISATATVRGTHAKIRSERSCIAIRQYVSDHHIVWFSSVRFVRCARL